MSLTQQELDDWNEWIAERYHELLGFATRFVGDPDAAADCVSKVLLEMLPEYWPGLKDDQHRIAWTMRVLKQRCIEALRRRNTRQKHYRDSSSFGDTASPLDLQGDQREPAPDQGLQQAEDAALVQQALQQLSPEQQQAIQWRYYEDLSFREIVERGGEPLSTIAARCSRGLLKLQEILRAHMQQ